jgi:hypothetical protein
MAVRKLSSVPSSVRLFGPSLALRPQFNHYPDSRRVPEPWIGPGYRAKFYMAGHSSEAGFSLS